MRLRTSLASLVMLSAAVSLSAQETALKVIPHDAGAALIVRNLQELRVKGDIAAGKIGRKDLKFSELMTEILKAGKIDGAVDESKPMAVLAVSTKSVGEKPLEQIVDFRVLSLLVLAVPFKDRDAIGAKLGFKPGELKTDEVQKVASDIFLFRVGYVKGNYLYMGMSEKAVKHAATAKRMSEELPENQLKILSQSDVLLQMGTFVWGKAWEDVLRGARKVFGEKMDAAEKDMGAKIVKSMEGIRFGIFGLRLEDERISLTVVSAWDKENKAVAEVLGLLRYSDTPTSLHGLPEGKLLFAETAKGNGVANAMLARVLFKSVLQDVLQTDEITTAAERPLVVGVFNDVWYHLLGNRTGLYQVAEAKKMGKIAVVSILDTADGQAFYDHFAELAQIGDGTLKPPALAVDKLIAELGGEDDNRRHELSLLKLRLAGLNAVPALEKVVRNKDDADVAPRASKLKEEILRLDKERRKGQDNWVLAVRPTLEVLPQTEKRKGLTVYMMKLKLPEVAGNLPATMATYLGSEWNIVRFAVHKKNVIMFLGSDFELFNAALENVKNDKPGLASSKYLQAFGQKVGPDRRVEFHMAMASLMALFAGEKVPAPKMDDMSSISLSVRPDSLQIDMWLPYDAVRPFNWLLPLR